MSTDYDPWHLCTIGIGLDEIVAQPGQLVAERAGSECSVGSFWRVGE